MFITAAVQHDFKKDGHIISSGKQPGVYKHVSLFNKRTADLFTTAASSDPTFALGWRKNGSPDMEWMFGPYASRQAYGAVCLPACIRAEHPLHIRAAVFPPAESESRIRGCRRCEQIGRSFIEERNVFINAGLFSRADDMAVLLEVMLNGGSYKHVSLFNKRTADLFTTAASSDLLKRETCL